MATAAPVTGTCSKPSALLATPWWRRLVRASAASGILGSAVLASAAAIELARAWTTTDRPGAEVGQVLGGVLIALFVVAAIGLATRARALAGVIEASAFALFAHGATLVLLGETVGGIFLGVALPVALLARLALGPRRARSAEAPRNAHASDARTRMTAWTSNSPATARAAEPAASPSRSVMHA